MFEGKNIDIDRLNKLLNGTMSEVLGMEVTELGDDFLKMRMPVDHRTKQPHGVLNGGASMALVESVASLAGNILVNPDRYCVGLEINGNHIRAIREGWVEATATPVHIGKSTQVWSVNIHDEKQKLICIARMTLAVLSRD